VHRPILPDRTVTRAAALLSSGPPSGTLPPPDSLRCA
jgi:hypothetical protein